MRGLTTETLRKLPRAELHVHLDGSLRVETALALAARQGLDLGASDAAALRARVVPPARGGDLVTYLQAFDLTCSLMQNPDAVEQIAYELALDHHADGVTYAEVRFCPSLLTQGSMTRAEALRAAWRGLQRAEAEQGIVARIIVCALRTLPLEDALLCVDAALAGLDSGVVGFDVAGAERGHPASTFSAALARAADGGLGITLHAGEAAGPESVEDALAQPGVRRIGHGTALRLSHELTMAVRDAGVTVEACLTSNLQTGAVATLGEHPLPRWLAEGVQATLCTDNTLVSDTTSSQEYRLAAEAFDLAPGELRTLALAGFSASFAEKGVRDRLLHSATCAWEGFTLAPGA